ncbi:APC family permease [Sulfurisphaera ohwakuensis]|uniref:Amino acid permease n=1 Tax=Sulfurisphaera ohwakuensis TaxID=69656 RepID=A0A650CJT1_SULOH|nr:APC family permease [Sulfurisphaera ohwakuensis]MBB5254833.1 amino acid transporter [Sulfurisphaera ohwakuensis]QGR18100.1 amino acid permease [Sulfurisphaera ohwakuensis]
MSERETKGARDFGISSDKQLRRSLGKFELLYLSLGGIIGSGWLFASLATATYAGASAILSWIIAGILVMFIGFAYAEIGAAIPKSGGITRYPHYTHGGLVGYLITWAYFLSAASVPAIEAAAAIEYIGSYYPQLITTGTFDGTTVTILTPLGIGLAGLLLIFFFFLNYFGVNILGKVTHGAGWWKLLVPTITFLALLALDLHSANFSLGGGFFPSAEYVKGGSSGIYGFSAVLYAIPSTGVIFSYLGFRQAVEYGGEGKNPKKDIPFAVIGSLLIAIVLYTLLQVAFVGGIDWNKLYLNESGTLVPVTPGNWSALSTAVTASGVPISAGPFLVLSRLASVYGLAAAFFTALAVLLTIDAVVSPSGTGWIYTGTSTRTLYAFASNGYLPEIFLKIGRTKIPTYSLIAALIIGFIFLLPFPSWYALVGFISSATVLTYIMGGIGLVVLRKHAADLNRPFKLPAAAIIGPIATLAAGLIVYWSSFAVLFYVFTGIFLGLPLFFIFYADRILGINKVVSIIVGVINLAISLGMGLLLFNETSGLSAANNLFFTIYIVVIAAMLIGDMIFLLETVPPDVKKEINAGWWLIYFILAIYIISYFGGFGLYTVIPFPYDTIVAAIVVLIGYFWAVRSGFRTQAIEDIIQATKEEAV